MAIHILLTESVQFLQSQEYYLTDLNEFFYHNTAQVTLYVLFYTASQNLVQIFPFKESLFSV